MSGAPGIGDIEVLICHPHGDLRVPLADWIAWGPGGRRLLRPAAAFDARTGAQEPPGAIPLRYRNTALSRLLIGLRLLPNPWPRPER
ncbi:MAG TPA: hypothetical protein VGE07_02670 [Herpetosiphonaceae bacterium]